MRHLISGLVAAVAVMAAAPAMACGYSARARRAGGLCQPVCGLGLCRPGRSATATAIMAAATAAAAGPPSVCAEPLQQYYYVNQGPTYTGPGNWAPQPTYRGRSRLRRPTMAMAMATGRGYGYGVGYGYGHAAMATARGYGYGGAPRADAPRYAPAIATAHRALRPLLLIQIAEIELSRRPFASSERASIFTQPIRPSRLAPI